MVEYFWEFFISAILGAMVGVIIGVGIGAHYAPVPPTTKLKCQRVMTAGTGDVAPAFRYLLCEEID